MPLYVPAGGGAAVDPLIDFDATAIALPTCIGYYKFDDPAPGGGATPDVVRASVGGLHGTILVGATSRPETGRMRAGGFKGAACFPGGTSPGGISFLDNYDFTGVNPFSIVLLATPSGGFTSTTRYLLTKATGGAGVSNFDSYIDSNQKVGFRRYDAAAAVDTITGGTSLAPNVERLIVLSYDGTNMRIFLDGVSDATAVASSKVMVNVATVAILGGLSGAVNGFSGEVARLGIYSTGLTLANAAALQALRN